MKPLTYEYAMTFGATAVALAWLGGIWFVVHRAVRKYRREHK